MDEAREENQWAIAAPILAMLQRCQSEYAQHIPWNPDAWNRPLQVERLREKLAAADAERRRLDEAKRDPEKLAALAAERRAAFAAFVSMVRE